MARKTSLLKASALALPLGCAALAAQAADIVGTLQQSERFSTLAGALAAAGPSRALQEEGPFTVFAPTDDAFNKLPQAARDRLLREENRAQLESLLGHHVVRGEAYPSDAIPDRLDPMAGGPIDIGLADRGLVVQPGGGQQALVVEGDIQADNGVIHAINTLLIPRQLAPLIQVAGGGATVPPREEPTEARPIPFAEALEPNSPPPPAAPPPRPLSPDVEQALEVLYQRPPPGGPEAIPVRPPKAISAVGRGPIVRGAARAHRIRGQGAASPGICRRSRVDVLEQHGRTPGRRGALRRRRPHRERHQALG